MVQRVNTTKKTSINIYATHDGQTEVTVQFDDEGHVWLTAKEIGVLYGRNVKTVMKHIQAILKEKEFTKVVVALFATTTPHGAMPSKTQSKKYRTLLPL